MGVEYTTEGEPDTGLPILAYDTSSIEDKESAPAVITLGPPVRSRAGCPRMADRILIWSINILLFEHVRGASCAAMPFVVIGNIAAAIFVLICAAILFPIGAILFYMIAFIAVCCMACDDLAKCLREQRDDLVTLGDSPV